MNYKSRIFYLFVCCIGLFSACNQKKETQTDTTNNVIEALPDTVNNSIGMLPAQSEYALLIDSGAIQIDINHLFLDFNGIPCLSMDTLIIPLSGDSTSILAFPYSAAPEQICCFADGSIFFLQDTCLLKVKNKSIEFSIPFPFRQMNINKAGEHGVYLSGFNPITQMNDVYFIDKNEEGIMKIISDTLAVGAVIGTGDISMVALDSTIYLLKEGEMQPVFQSDYPITSLADCEAGIFYATDRNAGYFNNEGVHFVFYNRGVSKLMTYMDTLYVSDRSGRFSKIMGTNYFKTLTDSLTY